ncbi:MFS general substrate transporter [Agrocybe pediades]|nr:MFS general substrate transporter [Agrocybe pediades]
MNADGLELEVIPRAPSPVAVLHKRPDKADPGAFPSGPSSVNDHALSVGQSEQQLEDSVQHLVRDGLAEDPSLPPVDEGRQAWIFCLASCTLETFVWGWNNTYGIFQDYYSSHPPFNTASPATLSVVGTTNLAIQYMEIVVVVAFVQRYPEYAKPLMWIGLCVAVLALVISSFATQVWQLILLQGIIFGLSAGAFYSPVLVWLSEWFVRRRGLAGGIIFGGSGLGGFILPLVMGYLLDAVGFRWTLRIWAATLGVVSAICLLGVKPRIPIRPPSTMQIPRQPWFPNDLSLFMSPLSYCMFGISIVQALGYFPVSLFIPTYTSSLSSATLPSTITLALFNVSCVVTYTLFGRICDSYPYPYVIFASGLGCALSAFFIWGFAHSLSAVFAFAAIFGAFGGGFAAIWPAAASDIGGNKDHITSLAIGYFAGVKGIGAIIGPIIAASLHNSADDHAKTAFGGYGFRNIEIFVGSMATATSIGAIILTFFSSTRKKVKV